MFSFVFSFVSGRFNVIVFVGIIIVIYILWFLFCFFGCFYGFFVWFDICNFIFVGVVIIFIVIVVFVVFNWVNVVYDVLRFVWDYSLIRLIMIVLNLGCFILFVGNVVIWVVYFGFCGICIGILVVVIFSFWLIFCGDNCLCSIWVIYVCVVNCCGLYYMLMWNIFMWVLWGVVWCIIGKGIWFCVVVFCFGKCRVGGGCVIVIYVKVEGLFVWWIGGN